MKAFFIPLIFLFNVTTIWVASASSDKFTHLSVVPAKAGIHPSSHIDVDRSMDPRLRVDDSLKGSVFARQGASHHPQDFLKSIAGSPNEGEQIVQHYCANCHAQKPIIPLGAPRIGKKEDWDPRIKQGIDILFKHTNEGINAMPARGGCFECSDKQLMLALASMLPKNTKRSTFIAPKDN